jgi:hypothetical protein
MARLVAALIALVAFAGLAIQFHATLSSGHSVGETLWILLRFFTVLTNIGVAVTMSVLALGKRVSSSWLGGLTLAILLVGLVYMTLLRGLLELSGGALVADILLHMATPVLVTFWWLGFADKGSLTWRDPLVWAIYTLFYLPYALTRGAAEGIYAYTFINVADLGWPVVLTTCAVIAAAFVIAGIGLVALDRKLGLARTAD